MTDCGCRKGAFRLGCERHDPGQALTPRGRYIEAFRRTARSLVAWLEKCGIPPWGQL